MRYYLTDSAEKDLEKIHKGNKKAAIQIEIFLAKLKAVDDFRKMPNAKKLKGRKNEWRFRVGEYRLEAKLLKGENGFFAEIAEIIAFASFDEMEDADEILEIHKIGPRQNAYTK